MELTKEAQAIKEYIEKNPLSKNSDIAKAKGVTPQTVHKFTKRLLEMGLIKTHSLTKIRRFYSAEIEIKNDCIFMYKYLEVMRKGKVIERISLNGMSSFMIEAKKEAVCSNLPPTYTIREREYKKPKECRYFIDNLN